MQPSTDPEPYLFFAYTIGICLSMSYACYIILQRKKLNLILKKLAEAHEDLR